MTPRPTLRSCQPLIRPPRTAGARRLLALAVGVLFVASAPAPAQASYHEQPFTVTAERPSNVGTGRCVVFTLTGNLKYTVTDLVSGGTMPGIPYRQYDGLTFAPTQMVARIKSRCGSTGFYQNASGLSYQLSVWAKECRLNVTPTISLPFVGVGVDISGDCKNERLARYVYSYTATTTSYVLKLTSATIKYPRTSRTLRPNGPAPCVNVAVDYATVYVSSEGAPISGSKVAWTICTNH